jgi:hypothetical protein
MELAPLLPPPEREAALREALEASLEVDLEEIDLETLGEFTRTLSEAHRLSLLEQALAVALRPSREEARAGGVVRLARYLPGPLLIEAMREARYMEGKRERVEVLAGIAPHLAAVPSLRRPKRRTGNS